MREILFRGKRIDNGEWIEGHYGEYMLMSGESIPCISIPNKEAVCGSTCCDVEVSTVGQYTGLTDKNGTRVFEGDILKEYGSAPEYSLMVIKNTGFGCFIEFYFHGEIHSTEQVGHTGWLSYDEVIGNIHDNPELLEVTK